MQEYLENGPLFSELKFYQRAAKPDKSEYLHLPVVLAVFRLKRPQTQVLCRCVTQ